jgi:elongation of very long chain fatty acids protein 6
VVMNYAVHAIMYGYYFLMAIKMKPKFLKGFYITAAQITQMIGGVIVTVLSFYYYKKHDNGDNSSSSHNNGSCFIQKQNNMAAFVMYGSYLGLFCHFFFLKYVNKKTVSGDKKKQN